MYIVGTGTHHLPICIGHLSFNPDIVAFQDKRCMYIFEINPLSVASFAIIFSQSEGCLFTLLIVSFVVKKLLSLIRSHLFIFGFISNILYPTLLEWLSSKR